MSSLGFGFEKLGLQVIRAPRIALTIVIAFTVFCAAGIPKLETDGTLSELFRSKTKDFKNYTEMSDRFPTSEFDVLVVIEGKDIMDRELLEEIRGLHLEMQFAQAVDGVISIFSMREQPDEKGYAAPMFPAELPEGEEFDRLAKRAMAHPLIQGKLLSDRDQNSQLTLLVLSLKKEVVVEKGLSVTIGEIDKLAREVLEPTGLKVQLAGAPVMQLEIRNAIKRDRFIYNGVGFLVGFIINLAFFRRPLLVFIASICPVLSVVWAIGILGHLDQRLTTFINVIPPLVMVIAFTDAMHMVFSIRRRLRDGMTRFEAARHAIRTVGPACVLT
ncbi:MAG: MMPL family transporter, partial [Methyloligellaceae bacterium]